MVEWVCFEEKNLLWICLWHCTILFPNQDNRFNLCTHTCGGGCLLAVQTPAPIVLLPLFIRRHA